MKPEAAKQRSGSETRKRHPRVYSRVTDDERAVIERDAAAMGLSVGGYLRWLAIDNPKTRAVRKPLADVLVLGQIKGQVGRIGGNLHQLLKKANRGELPWTEEVVAAAKDVSDFLTLAAEILRGA
jgi:hypothetical protein